MWTEQKGSCARVMQSKTQKKEKSYRKVQQLRGQTSVNQTADHFVCQDDRQQNI